MPLVTVPTESAIRVCRTPGSDVVFVNQSTIDVYFDMEPGRLNSTPVGSTPSGTKLAANGGEKQFQNFPSGGVWFRAAAYTSIEVQG
jgi:hypothetical protein